jgi:hypothetical protein
MKPQPGEAEIGHNAQQCGVSFPVADKVSVKDFPAASLL